MAKVKTPEKPTNIKFVLRSFTDSEIEQILAQSTNFRELRGIRVERYYAVMARGAWNWSNGEPLIFDSDMRLLNGQHRLAAAQRFQRDYSVTCWFWCAIGVDRAAAVTMDAGDSRKLADYLKNAGVPNYNAAACIVSADSRLRLADRPDLAPLVRAESMRDKITGKPSYVRDDAAMSVDTYRRNKAAVDYWASQMSKLHSAGLPSASLLSAIGYQLAKREEVNAKLFFSYLADGAGLKENDPVLGLRNRLIESKISPSRFLPKIHLAAITVKAWVAWLKGESLRGSSLRFQASGPRAEEFPSHLVAKEEVSV